MLVFCENELALYMCLHSLKTACKVFLERPRRNEAAMVLRKEDVVDCFDKWKEDGSIFSKEMDIRKSLEAVVGD